MESEPPIPNKSPRLSSLEKCEIKGIRLCTLVSNIYWVGFAGGFDWRPGSASQAASEPWSRTNGVNANGAAAEVRPGTFREK